MKALGRGSLRRGGWAAGIYTIGLLAACDDGGYGGPLARLSGSFNGWAKGERAPALRWDGTAYRGVVDLPGDALQLHLYLPYSGQLLGGSGATVGVPGRARVIGSGDGAATLRIDTPLPARYEVAYVPSERRLYIDLAEDAEQDQPPAAAQLVLALRGADRATPAERAERAEQLARSLDALGAETPLRVGQGERRGVTFLAFGRGEAPPAVVGDFNDWREGPDTMRAALDGHLAYRGRTAAGVRLEYRLSVRGQRFVDPRNPDVIWDGAYLPANLHNVLGGNVGEFNSVAMTPGYVEKGSRLQRLVVQQREILVYLPPGYGDDARDYPSLYVHDGKDAIVRGRYNQALDRLITSGTIPPVVGVFVPAQSDPTARLNEYSHVKDPYFSDVSPQGAAHERFLLEILLPEIEHRYRVRRDGAQRAMLGIDMAGPFTFHVAWNDSQRRFRRVASQSGRFGWGSSDPTRSPYVEMLAQDRSDVMSRVSFDWADGDPFQVQVHESVLKPRMGNSPAYRGKVLFLRQDRPAPGPTPSVWDNWRMRLDTVLTFLLSDLK